MQALAKSSNEANYDFMILEAVMQVNDKQKLHLLPRIKAYFNNDLDGHAIKNARALARLLTPL